MKKVENLIEKKDLINTFKRFKFKNQKNKFFLKKKTYFFLKLKKKSIYFYNILFFKKIFYKSEYLRNFNELKTIDNAPVIILVKPILNFL